MTQGEYVRVSGLRMYYEVHGAGKPLIILHGGVVGITMFGPTLPALAQGRQVIAPEMQGHGRTPDIGRPLRYDALADDILGLMKHLGIPKADVLGNSLGAGVALRMAIDHPEAVDRLVIISFPFKRTGWHPEVRASFDRMGPADGKAMKKSPLASQFPSVNWEALFSKIGDLQRQNYDWSKGVAGIKAPVLLVFADADAISTSHIAEFYGLLGGGKRDAGLDGSGRSQAQLAIVPGATHYTVLTSPVVAQVVNGFLERTG